MLIPMDKYGVFANEKGTVLVDSYRLAKYMGKSHNEVLETIAIVTDPKYGFSSGFICTNFVQVKCGYAMTREGFYVLTRYLNSKEYIRKLYTKRFNKTETDTKALAMVKREFPLLFENIMRIYGNPEPYRYINECDMIKSVVLGISVKKYRDTRHFITPKQSEQFKMLEIADIGLLIAEPNYQKRRRYLEWYIAKMEE